VVVGHAGHQSLVSAGRAKCAAARQE
jgi:hypothetical protein